MWDELQEHMVYFLMFAVLGALARSFTQEGIEQRLSLVRERLLESIINLRELSERAFEEGYPDTAEHLRKASDLAKEALEKLQEGWRLLPLKKG